MVTILMSFWHTMTQLESSGSGMNFEKVTHETMRSKDMNLKTYVNISHSILLGSIQHKNSIAYFLAKAKNFF